jgi:hypothetical protein
MRIKLFVKDRVIKYNIAKKEEKVNVKRKEIKKHLGQTYTDCVSQTYVFTCYCFLMMYNIR